MALRALYRIIKGAAQGILKRLLLHLFIILTMLFPKKVKHRKWQSDRRNPAKKVVATRGTKLQFGAFGLRAADSARVKSNHIESARKVVSRTIGKTGKYWIRIFPDRPITQKAD